MPSLKIKRNDPCPCGSGKKYKKCCLIKRKPPLPIRSREHILDTLAVDFVRTQLPAAWTYEEVSKDYGKDLRIEIFNDHPVVGHVASNQEFVVQSKGHEEFSIVYGDQVAQQLKISTLNYLTLGLLPSLLVAYSEKEKKACYLWLRPYVDQVLEKQNADWRNTAGDSEITVHIPLQNVLNESSFIQIRQHVINYHNNLLKQDIGSYSILTSSTPKISQITPYQLRHPQIKNCLKRPHLTEKLSQMLPTSNVFLHAGAGYGKTWLIHDLITTHEFPIVIWFTFDKTVCGVQFIRLLATELYKQTKTTGEATLTHLDQMGINVQLNQAIAVFRDELSRIDSVILIALEDLHFVSDNEVKLVINYLLSERFANLQIILTSRYPLPFKQAKFKSQGLLTVIAQKEMGFSLSETQNYFENNWGIDLPTEQLYILHQRIGEWVAALGLAANVLDEKGSDKIEDLLNRLNGYEGNIYDFFAEEVYVELTEEEQKLLKRLGLVYLIEPDVVNLFTNVQNGGAILRKLHAHNTFLIRNSNNSYKLHSLFSEFLEAKLLDDEGMIAIENAHKILAQYYHKKCDWYSVTEHASKGKEYDLAIHGLTQIAPTSINLGFGYFFLEFVKMLPEESLKESALLQEMIGRAALQTGQLDQAIGAFVRATTLYQNLSDIDRTRFFLAEIQIDKGLISNKEFVTIAQQIASNCYKEQEYFFGCQVEIRAIESAQTLTVHAPNMKKSLKALIQQTDNLLKRLDKLGQEYNFIKSKAFTTKAHLLLQKITTQLNEESSKYRIREDMGHPIPPEEKLEAVRSVVHDLHFFSQLHEEAQNLLGDKNEIQLAFTRLRFIDDNVMLANMIKLCLLVSDTKSTSFTQLAEITNTNSQLRDWFLPLLDRCGLVFAKNHVIEGLANVYFVAAEIYDSLKEIEHRNKMATEALVIANEYGYVDLANKTKKLLQGIHTYSWVTEQANEQSYQYEKVASWTEEDKRKYVETYLRAFGDDVDDKRRHTIEVSVDEMVLVAQYKQEWCQHLDLVEDLEHEKSLATIHREIPNKYIICKKLEHRSLNSGKHFQELWPFFRGVFCLGCSSKSPLQSESYFYE